MVPTTTSRERVTFVHVSCFSPSPSTLIAAIDAGRMTGFPWLTSELIRRHLPLSRATVKGHLDQQRKNLRSTQPKPALETPTGDSPETIPPVSALSSPVSPNADGEADELSPQPDEPLAPRSHFLYAACAEITGKVFSDQTGRFLTSSTSGNKEILILYDYDSNFIHAEAMKDRSGPEILMAYKRGHELLSSRGLRPQLQKLDNEASALAVHYNNIVSVRT